MEQPPSDTPPLLKEYLSRVLSNVELSVGNASKLPILTNVPARPVKGKMYYFDNVIGTTITSAGVWVYKGNSVWSLLG